MFKRKSGPPNWFAQFTEACELGERCGIDFKDALVEVGACPRNYVLHRRLPWWTWLFLFPRLRLWFLRTRLLALPYQERHSNDPRVMEASELIARWEFCYVQLSVSEQLRLRKQVIFHDVPFELVRRGFSSRHLKADGRSLSYRALSLNVELPLRMASVWLLGFALLICVLVFSQALLKGCLNCEGVVLLQGAGCILTMAWMSHAEGYRRKRTEEILDRLGVISL